MSLSPLRIEPRMSGPPTYSQVTILRLCIAVSRKPSYLHKLGTEPLSPETTGQIVDRAAQEWGDRDALVSVHQGHRLSFRKAKEEADKLAAGLLGLGLKTGDRLGICGPNSSHWYLTFIAAAQAGFVLVNINPAYQIPELQYCLTKVGVKALIAPESFKTQRYHEMVCAIAPEVNTCAPGQIRSKRLPDLSSLIMITDRQLPGAFRFSDVVESATPELVSTVQQLQSQIQPDDGCNLQFTSGTTGQPKATLLNHHNTVNNMLIFGKRAELSRKAHRICLQVPFFHCFGNVLGIMASLIYGATIVLPGASFKAEESIEAIQKERCTVVYGTPTMYVDLLAIAKKTKNLNTDTLDLGMGAGALFSKELIQDILQTFKLRRFCVGYGMTETSPLSFLSMPDDTPEKQTSTVGCIMDHVEAKVVDANGKMVPFGTPGELLIRGYLNMLGYWDEDGRTKEILGLDRWVRTGDQFVLQEDGYGQVVGRIKEMIIRGGENIFPKEIEQVLEQHSEILEAQVIGVPDSRLGEEVCACLRLVDGAKLTADQVKQYCKGKISRMTQLQRNMDLIHA
ncbi:medium-chain acyl-CoA ligase ACSF2, mitochondrial isoform X2 [Cryptotermes secundus]|uniref:medium-chain acyl-CoA ligase ACSF2, mitochondrial isoform X2 n=1 Tax=Cryptotermes secundus TaxID=105785 RepID=UPI001454E3AF|nr:medium-chain acyl-CoA ligase ACSF2, mitochondrial isoform X2 [Cryptotermes secundus]